MIKIKKCTKCKRELPETEEYFHKDKLGKNGFRSQCKECRNEYHEQHRKKNQKRIKERQDKWKLKVMENSPLNISYSGVHRFLRDNNTAPEYCEICNEKKSVELANITGIYSKDLRDYAWLCKQCHGKFDRKNNQPPSTIWECKECGYSGTSRSMVCIECGNPYFKIKKEEAIPYANGQENPSEQDNKHCLKCEYDKRNNCLEEVGRCINYSKFKEKESTSSASYTVDYPCEKSKGGRHDFFISFGKAVCRNCHKTDIEIKEKEPTGLDNMANIEQIIEKYDNGHENVFYPDTHIVVKKAVFIWLYKHATQDEDTETLEEYTEKMKEIEKFREDNDEGKVHK